MTKKTKLALCVALCGILGIAARSAPATAPIALASAAALPAFDGTLSILTYNVEGLPWPIARGRSEKLEAIADRLRQMRAQGTAPQIVALQEAFTDEAQAIGAVAGYRYVVSGPAADVVGAPAVTAPDQAFAAAARWWKGETAGKLVGSGLMILSDYSIAKTRRMVFPAYACAGFDCLANKGALMVSIELPGLAHPIDIFTTHLNSRHASGVSVARADYAYLRQVATLSAFVREAHDPLNALIAAGDFNVGPHATRRGPLLADARSSWNAAGAVHDALNEARLVGMRLPTDAAFTLRRGRDWQFFAPGRNMMLDLTAIDVPFGHDAAGDMMSDHVGYVARFSLKPAGLRGEHMIATLTTSGRSRT